MKYLVLFLLVMFSCNVYAETLPLGERIKRMPYELKQKVIENCETANYSDDVDDIKRKANVCFLASEILAFDEQNTKSRKAFLDFYRYLVKSCNFYDLTYNKEYCDRIYIDYKMFCFQSRDEQLCNILKDYYKLY